MVGVVVVVGYADLDGGEAGGEEEGEEGGGGGGGGRGSHFWGIGVVSRLEFEVIFDKGVGFGSDGCLVVWYEVVDGLIWG